MNKHTLLLLTLGLLGSSSATVDSAGMLAPSDVMAIMAGEIARARTLGRHPSLYSRT